MAGHGAPPALVWVAAAVLGHSLLHWPCCASLLHRALAERWPVESPRLVRRLIRSALYEGAAFAAGAALLVFEYDDVWDAPALAAVWNGRLAAACSIACGHWVVAFLEDFFTPDGFRVGGPCAYRAFLAHHLAAAAVYGYILATGRLGGIGVFGLVYEGPALFASLRELALALGVDGAPAVSYACWRWTALLLLPCRAGPTCYYAVFDAAPRPGAEAAVYHAVSLVFALFSLGWCGLLVVQYGADVRNFSARRRRYDAEDPPRRAALPGVGINRRSTPGPGYIFEFLSLAQIELVFHDS